MAANGTDTLNTDDCRCTHCDVKNEDQRKGNLPPRLEERGNQTNKHVNMNLEKRTPRKFFLTEQAEAAARDRVLKRPKEDVNPAGTRHVVKERAPSVRSR